ncbi:hypothetical protein, conserved in T.vivax [Trypanosoma vivax Y486]|uniref:Uncharacterized protein n=1 Tax=Trypanosoma vivax (strain Y486) TaxID=1055687 RepID=F9WTY0_TRYVY|nr:hypothetical protein, conserved in T.vivax [Trypanosoma vivax Y486]|eukprot:CCD21026.1 hypothetical protein, conserved in T.vivax [Trypanosoma vivax Y486]
MTQAHHDTRTSKTENKAASSAAERHRGRRNEKHATHENEQAKHRASRHKAKVATRTKKRNTARKHHVGKGKTRQKRARQRNTHTTGNSHTANWMRHFNAKARAAKSTGITAHRAETRKPRQERAEETRRAKDRREDKNARTGHAKRAHSKKSRSRCQKDRHAHRAGKQPEQQDIAKEQGQRDGHIRRTRHAGENRPTKEQDSTTHATGTTAPEEEERGTTNTTLWRNMKSAKNGGERKKNTHQDRDTMQHGAQEKQEKDQRARRHTAHRTAHKGQMKDLEMERKITKEKRNTTFRKKKARQATREE